MSVEEFDDALAERMAHELVDLPPMELGLRPESVFQLVGALQLVQRHPLLPPTVRATAEAFVAAARRYFINCPAVLEMVRRGDDPAEDR